MGDEIKARFFQAEDFSLFRRRLDEETVLLGNMFKNNEFSRRGEVAGFELEAWLIDDVFIDSIPEAENTAEPKRAQRRSVGG